MSPLLLPCGPNAVMIEVGSTEEAAAMAAHLRAADLAGIVDLVPAARTVLVSCASGGHLDAVRSVATSFQGGGTDLIRGVLVEVPTVYDGPDLASVADTTSMTVEQLIDLHSSTEYTAAFCGFVPGFTYLTGLPAVLRLPRRPSPRTVVPAGSVAIGADFTGVYPTDSPGGWHLLGRALVAMWDSNRSRPAFVEPGDRVRFVRTEG